MRKLDAGEAAEQMRWLSGDTWPSADGATGYDFADGWPAAVRVLNAIYERLDLGGFRLCLSRPEGPRVQHRPSVGDERRAVRNVVGVRSNYSRGKASSMRSTRRSITAGSWNLVAETR